MAPRKVERLNRIGAALLISWLFAGPPALADEFDPLAVYSEAKPLNDRWQACLASFVRPRLRSKQAPEALVKKALEACRPEERRLRHFFVDRIGSRSAQNVIGALREKYRFDLAAVINEYRQRE